MSFNLAALTIPEKLKVHPFELLKKRKVFQLEIRSSIKTKRKNRNYSLYEEKSLLLNTILFKVNFLSTFGKVPYSN